MNDDSACATGTSTITHDNDASFPGFMAAWRRITTGDDAIAEVTRAGYALIGLTNFGEHPVKSTRVAEVLGWPAGEVEALARQGVWDAGRGRAHLRQPRTRTAGFPAARPDR